MTAKISAVMFDMGKIGEKQTKNNKTAKIHFNNKTYRICTYYFFLHIFPSELAASVSEDNISSSFKSLSSIYARLKPLCHRITRNINDEERATSYRLDSSYDEYERLFAYLKNVISLARFIVAVG